MTDALRVYDGSRMIGRLRRGDAGSSLVLDAVDMSAPVAGAPGDTGPFTAAGAPKSGEALALWIDGLTPWGGRRRREAAALALDPTDLWAWLARLGGDVAGQWRFELETPDRSEASAPPAHLRLDAARLADLARRAAGGEPLTGVGGAASLVCAADQRVALACLPHGDDGAHDTPCEFLWPVRGAPSTHWAWVEPSDARGEFENALFHRALAAEIGLTVSAATTQLWGASRMLAAPRSDRSVDGAGVRRRRAVSFAELASLSPEAAATSAPASARQSLAAAFRGVAGMLGPADRIEALDRVILAQWVVSPTAPLLDLTLTGSTTGPAAEERTEMRLAPLAYFTGALDGARGGAKLWKSEQWRDFALTAGLNPTFTAKRVVGLAEKLVAAAAQAAAIASADPLARVPIVSFFQRRLIGRLEANMGDLVGS